MNLLWQLLYLGIPLIWFIISKLILKNKVLSKESVIPYVFIWVAFMVATYISSEIAFDLAKQTYFGNKL